MSLFSTIVTQLMNGLQTGSVYALVALGYSMVYGIILLLNFAHGDIIMVGAYTAWLFMVNFGQSPFIAVIAAIVACTVLGVVIEKVAYTPLRKAPRLSLLITAIGISFLLENLAQLIFGAGARPVPSIIDVAPVTVGSVSISGTAIVTI
ncbi:MAG TPA: branched-chain amino acid ABC transporter permease, partial [Clostridia bacterium]|nr:branched-chain amino acid ABC transporter permease [Clostridia bacterium]